MTQAEIENGVQVTKTLVKLLFVQFCVACLILLIMH